MTSLWHTVRLVLLCSSIFSYSCTSAHLHTDLCLPTPFSPHSTLVLSHPSRPALSHSTLSTRAYPFIGSFLNSLAVLSVSLSVLNFLTFLFHYDTFCFSTHDLFNYSPHFLLTLSPFRYRLLRIVLLIWSDCPRAGPFATATLSRSWNSVATTAWLGLALAATCAFYVVFASPSQDKLSGIWGGCSFTFHQVSLLLPMRSHCLRVYLALDFSQNSISYEILNSRPIIKTPFHILHFLVTCTLALA